MREGSGAGRLAEAALGPVEACNMFICFTPVGEEDRGRALSAVLRACADVHWNAGLLSKTFSYKEQARTCQSKQAHVIF